MEKKLVIFISDLFKVFCIMYINLFIKNVLQIILGYIFTSDTNIKVYRLYNISETIYDFFYIILLILVYDFLIFVKLFYSLIFLILYIIIRIFGNKLWIHVLYSLSIYIIAITFFDPYNYNIFFILIVMLLAYVNYFLFDKWVKLK